MNTTQAMLDAFRRGERERAATLAREILSTQADEHSALQILAVVAWEQADWPTAVDCFGRVAALQPRDAGARFNHAEALRKSGDTEHAIGAFDQALAVAPDHVPSLVTLARLLTGTPRRTEILSLLNRAVTAAPRDPKARLARGQARLAQGRRDGLGDLRLAAELMPDNAEVHLTLGRGLADARRFDEADQALARAVALQPEQAKGHLDRGKLAMLRHDPATAIAHYRQALSHVPKHAEAHALLAQALHETRDGKAAAEHLQKALEANPANRTARLLDAQMRRGTGDLTGARAILEKLVEDLSDPAPRSEALAELGHCLDRLGDYTAAFRHFSEANRCVATGVAGDDPVRNIWPARIAAMRALGDAAFPSVAASTSAARPAPLFIVGFPRSGTTLIEQILATHGAFVTSDEAPLIGRLARQFDNGNPAALSRLTERKLSEMRDTYWRSAEALFPAIANGKRFVDKQPWNLVELPLIARLFPDARILVMLRDPRDVCLSAFMQYFALDPATIQLLTLEDTAATYAGAMDLWLAWRDRPPLRCMELRYEDLVRDVDAKARAVATFLDAPWDDAILSHGAMARRRAISTPSRDAVSSAVTHRAVGRWRNYADELEPILPTLAPYVAQFGYDPD